MFRILVKKILYSYPLPVVYLDTKKNNFFYLNFLSALFYFTCHFKAFIKLISDNFSEIKNQVPIKSYRLPEFENRTNFAKITNFCPILKT